MPILTRSSLLALSLALSLAACGGSGSKDAAGEADPALSGALGDGIMVDPDLAGDNQAGGGIGMGSGDGALPPDNNSPEEIAAAKREALKLVGGPGKLKDAPEARVLSAGQSAGPDLTAAARTAALPVSGAVCTEMVEYTMEWAARLPKPFPVYPRAKVLEAAGTDAQGCALRVVTFTTPVPIDDVMNFYFSRARAAGYEADIVSDGTEQTLGGTRNGAAYLVTARALPSGRTEVDLTTSGK